MDFAALSRYSFSMANGLTMRRKRAVSTRVASRVPELLQRLGCSQGELAHMLDMTEDKLSKSLKGARNFNPPEWLLIAKLLGVSPSELTGLPESEARVTDPTNIPPELKLAIGAARMAHCPEPAIQIIVERATKASTHGTGSNRGRRRTEFEWLKLIVHAAGLAEDE